MSGIYRERAGKGACNWNAVSCFCGVVFWGCQSGFWLVSCVEWCLTTLCRTYLMVTLHLSSDWKPPVPPFARYTGGPLIIRITCYPRRFLSKAKCMYLWVRFPLDIDVQLVDAGPHDGQSELFLIRNCRQELTVIIVTRIGFDIDN